MNHLRCVSPAQAQRERATLLDQCLTRLDRSRGILAASRYVRARERAREDRRAFWLACALVLAFGLPLLWMAHRLGR